jgi:hypothetical protein
MACLRREKTITRRVKDVIVSTNAGTKLTNVSTRSTFTALEYPVDSTKSSREGSAAQTSPAHKRKRHVHANPIRFPFMLSRPRAASSWKTRQVLARGVRCGER